MHCSTFENKNKKRIFFFKASAALIDLYVCYFILILYWEYKSETRSFKQFYLTMQFCQ